MTARDELLHMLRSRGALLEGHFQRPDGRHTDLRLRPLKATQFAPINRKLCYEIVRHFLELDIHVVVAASVEAIPVAVEVGRQLEARTIFTAPGVEPPTLYEGFELHDGERVVVVQSLLTSDSEIDGIAALLRGPNARLIGVGSIVDARESRRRYTVKDVSAVQMPPRSYPADSCPLCASGIPLSPRS